MEGASEDFCESKGNGLLMSYSSGLSLPGVLPQLPPALHVGKGLYISHSCLWLSGIIQFTFQGVSLVLGFRKAQ